MVRHSKYLSFIVAEPPTPHPIKLSQHAQRKVCHMESSKVVLKVINSIIPNTDHWSDDKHDMWIVNIIIKLLTS